MGNGGHRLYFKPVVQLHRYNTNTINSLSLWPIVYELKVVGKQGCWEESPGSQVIEVRLGFNVAPYQEKQTHIYAAMITIPLAIFLLERFFLPGA
jgi:hypothetical protein